MKKLFLVIVLTFAYGFSLYAYYEKNYPITVTQPDGTIVECFATGDEFYNWVHDEDGFTLIRDPQTGVVVYAKLENDELVSTGYRAGSVDPASIGLTPWLNVSAEKRMQKRADFLKNTSEKPVNEGIRGGHNNGTLNNLVIYVRFSDETEFSPEKAVTYNHFHNRDESEYPSMYSYYKAVSGEKTFIQSTFYPVNLDNAITSYQDTYPRSYFQPYNAATNPNGYQSDGEGMKRGHLMFERAINYVKAEVPTDLDLDFNNDGDIDNISFIVRGYAGAWSSFLWPHRSSLRGMSQEIYINGKRAWDYNMQIEAHLDGEGASVLSHEMFHTLGAPDLYRYNDNTIDPVGSWDLMCANASPPQSTTAYMKWKYGGWIDNIPEITETGTYTLNNVWSVTNNACKIASPNSSTEYFVIEYRDKNVYWDKSLPGSGLIIYRINTKAHGNADGPPDELYIFRSGGHNNTTPGGIGSAYFSSQSGRTVFGDNSNPPCFLSNNQSGGILIYNIEESGGETMSFYVDFTIVHSEIYVSKNDLAFADVPIGTTSAPQTISVYGEDLVHPLLYQLSENNSDLFTIEENTWEPLVGGVLSVRFTPNEAKIFTASLTFSAIGAASQTVTLRGSGSNVAIDEQNTADNITIYPNPTNEKLRIESEEWRIESVEFFDVMGRNILFVDTQRITSLQNGTTNIDMSHLPSGVYFVKITTENGVITKKVIKY